MMQKILDFMFKSVVSLSEYDRYMILLDMRDNEGKTAIQYASEYVLLYNNSQSTNCSLEIQIVLITYRSCNNTTKSSRTSNSQFCLVSLCGNMYVGERT